MGGRTRTSAFRNRNSPRLQPGAAGFEPLHLEIRSAELPQRNVGVDRAPERFVRSAARFEMREFESWPPGLRVWANTDSNMQRFGSRRPSQPVRLQRVTYEGRSKTAPDPGRNDACPCPPGCHGGLPPAHEHPSSDGREGHVDLADDASASSVRHHIGEPYARKDQYTCESRRDGIHNHAMPIIIIAFRAFIFLRGPGRASILAQHYRWARSRSDFRATCQLWLGLRVRNWAVEVSFRSPVFRRQREFRDPGHRVFAAASFAQSARNLWAISKDLTNSDLKCGGSNPAAPTGQSVSNAYEIRSSSCA
jgi:hypothetical protein